MEISHSSKTTTLYIMVHTFNVIKLPLNPIILALSWLKKYNIVIDWKTRRLAFQPNIASI
jgi:hypothetical protein